MRLPSRFCRFNPRRPDAREIPEVSGHRLEEGPAPLCALPRGKSPLVSTGLSRLAFTRFGISRTQRSGREPPTRRSVRAPPIILLTAIVRSTSHPSYPSNVVNSPTTITLPPFAAAPGTLFAIRREVLYRRRQLPLHPPKFLMPVLPTLLIRVFKPIKHCEPLPSLLLSSLHPPKKDDEARLLCSLVFRVSMQGWAVLHSIRMTPGSLPPPHPILSLALILVQGHSTM